MVTAKKAPAKAVVKVPVFSADEISAFRKPDHPTFEKSAITVGEAREYAFSLHKGQKDKSGEDYHHHLEAVRAGVEVLGGDDEEQIAALLHDSLEDTSATRTVLRKHGVSEYAVKIIEAVTKPVGSVQTNYLDTIIKAGPGAMRVKTADLMHNLRHDRMAALTEYTRDRLLKKYRPSLARLLMELELIVDEDTQKKLATKPIGTAGGWTGGSSSKTISVAVSSLFKGDWASWWKAPLVEKHLVGDSWVLTLANGQIITEDKKRGNITVYPKHTWENDTTINFYGVSEDDIENFIEVLNHSNTTLTGGTTT